MKYILENESLKISIQSKGAELISLIRKENKKEYLWQADPSFWNRHAPVLFPIVGKLKNNNYSVKGKQYLLSQHGFARDLEFTLEQKEDDKLVFSLEDQKRTMEIYPYKFKFQISYQLNGSRISVSYKIYNKDDAEIFFSVGAHPAFFCPLNKDESFEDYYLEFEKSELVHRHLLTNGLFNGKKEIVIKNSNKLPLFYDLFEKDAIVFKDLKSTEITLKSYRSKNGVKVSFPGFPYLGVWTKTSGAPFLCIEPWCGLADSENSTGDLREKEGITELQPANSFQREFQIEVF